MGMEVVNNMDDNLEMSEVDLSDSELVSHVRDALKAVYEGDTESYDQLIMVVTRNDRLSPDDVGLLVTSLKALTGAVAYIDSSQHSALISSIFRMSMWNYTPDVMDALVNLIICLAASNAKLVDLSLEMLISNFIPPVSFLPLLNRPRGITRKEQVLDRVHAALKSIAELVPLTPLRLSPIILQMMPRITHKEAANVIYVENMLKLESSPFGEFVGSTMLLAVMDRLIQLDVEISWDDILQQTSTKGIFDMELEDVEEFDDYTERDGSAEGNVVAQKLDSLMVLLCEHLKSCADSGRLIKVFETLVLSFRVSVLNSYKSKFAQFVVFYACSLDPENCGVRFAIMLADIFLSTSSPPIDRMSAVSYLASYLSRAKFLQTSIIAITLKRLVDWCLEYCQLHDGEERTINPQAHRIFYSACQAIMYVLCFRMKAMLEVPQLKSQILQFSLQKIFQHSLDPLKVCLPSIVDEFLRQAEAASLFSAADHFIFNNLLETELSKAYGGIERLDMFFPFDPLMLKKSDRYIRPNFIYWAMVRTTYDNDSSDEDADEPFENGSNTGFSDDDETMGRSFDDHIDLDEFENTLNKMSITPKFSLKYMEGGNLKMPRMPARIRPSTSPESL